MNPTVLRERLQQILAAANTAIDDGLGRAHNEHDLTAAYRAGHAHLERGIGTVIADLIREEHQQ